MFFVLLLASAAQADDLQQTGSLTLSHTADPWDDVSGIAFSDDRELLFLTADEDGGIRTFRRSGVTKYEMAASIDVRPKTDRDQEADLEALAVDGEWLYAIGSHSAKREKVDPAKSRQKNRKRLYRSEREKGRRQLLRIRLDSLLNDPPEIDRANLWKRIQGDSLLRPFTRIPSKENGVDIEGLAIDGERVLVGFRSPILRGDFALVLNTGFGKSSDTELLFVDLGGLGIRDMARIDSERFLLLCGPSNDAAGTYKLVLWDGEDCVPDEERPGTDHLIELGVIPPPEGHSKPEGVALFKQQANTLEVVIVFDGALDGAPTLFSVEVLE